MVECTALEMRHRCKPIGGSNPSLSARPSKIAADIPATVHGGRLPNGRKLNFISYDDAYNPPKAIEQTRKLLFGPMGTASNTAIQKCVNSKKCPDTS